MALLGISAGSSQIRSIAPATFPSDEPDDLQITDPDMMVEREIIEQLFSPDKEDAGNNEPVIAAQPESADTVGISSQAMELYSRSGGEARIETPDGTKIRVSVDRESFVRLEQSAEVQTSDPLILDLEGDGIELTDVTSSGGVRFDITGDGRKERVSWVSPDDALLAYDRNGNGIIDGGKELFGDQHGSDDGFAELGRFDANRDGIIDKNDSAFGNLLVWRDKNGNGESERDELKTPDEHGITGFSYRSDGQKSTIAGNLIDGYSRFSGAKGPKPIAEALLNYYA